MFRPREDSRLGRMVGVLAGVLAVVVAVLPHSSSVQEPTEPVTAVAADSQ
jgi:hypothetical protein